MVLSQTSGHNKDSLWGEGGMLLYCSAAGIALVKLEENDKLFSKSYLNLLQCSKSLQSLQMGIDIWLRWLSQYLQREVEELV